MVYVQRNCHAGGGEVGDHTLHACRFNAQHRWEGLLEIVGGQVAEFQTGFLVGWMGAAQDGVSVSCRHRRSATPPLFFGSLAERKKEKDKEREEAWRLVTVPPVFKRVWRAVQLCCPLISMRCRFASGCWRPLRPYVHAGACAHVTGHSGRSLRNRRSGSSSHGCRPWRTSARSLNSRRTRAHSSTCVGRRPPSTTAAACAKLADFAGKDAHRAILPAIPERPKRPDTMDGMDQEEQLTKTIEFPQLQSEGKNIVESIDPSMVQSTQTLEKGRTDHTTGAHRTAWWNKRWIS